MNSFDKRWARSNFEVAGLTSVEERWVKNLAFECVPKNAYGQWDAEDLEEAEKVCLWLLPILKRRRNMAFVSYKDYVEKL